MPVIFPFKKEKSPVFGTIHRPLAEVLFLSKVQKLWQPLTMIVDTGADYTLLPFFLTSVLEILPHNDCQLIETQGVGGKTKVYLLKNKIPVRIGNYERKVPVGFAKSNYLPPLLGRHEFLETFRVVFDKFQVQFE